MITDQYLSYFYKRASLLALVLFLSWGCGRTERAKVDEMQAMLNRKEYDLLTRSYDSIAHSLKSPEQLRRARAIYDTAYSIHSQCVALISSADSLALQGFAPEAYRKYSLAFSLEPTDSTILIKRNTVPASGKPIYKFTGKVGERDFELTFHTKWIHNDLLPEFVQIQVTNQHPTEPVLPAAFVPFIHYMEVDRSGMRILEVDIKPNIFPPILSKLLWRGESMSAKLDYSKAKVMTNNPALSYSEVFRRTMFGNDEACYIYMLGYKYSKVRGFALVGYDE
jgi:hypothetical protein